MSVLGVVRERGGAERIEAEPSACVRSLLLLQLLLLELTSVVLIHDLTSSRCSLILWGRRAKTLYLD